MKEFIPPLLVTEPTDLEHAIIAALACLDNPRPCLPEGFKTVVGEYFEGQEYQRRLFGKMQNLQIQFRRFFTQFAREPGLNNIDSIYIHPALFI